MLDTRRAQPIRDRICSGDQAARIRIQRSGVRLCSWIGRGHGVGRA